MKKITVLFLAGLFCAALSSAALAADPYDRYERDRGEPPPPRAADAPPPPRSAGVPPPRHAVYGQPYFFGHLGIFDPNSDSDGLSSYDSGMNLDFGVGSRVSPLLALEGTIGAYGAERGSNEASVVPMTVGARLVIPHPFIEPYLGAGLGLYFTKLKEPGAGVGGIDDTSTDFGGYLSVGADFWLNPRIALNIEGKYHFVNPAFEDASGRSWDVNMSGWTANMGVRVSF